MNSSCESALVVNHVRKLQKLYNKRKRKFFQEIVSKNMAKIRNETLVDKIQSKINAAVTNNAKKC